VIYLYKQIRQAEAQDDPDRKQQERAKLDWFSQPNDLAAEANLRNIQASTCFLQFKPSSLSGRIQRLDST
jgi:hypothetical protein